MNYFSIPLTSAPDQTFTTTVNINNENVTASFRIRYNSIGKYWTITMYTSGNDQNIVDDVVVYCGYEYYNDLLEPYKYKMIGSLFVVPRKIGLSDYPSMTNLNSDYWLVWGDELAR